MGPREDHDEAFDRDRWQESVADRTLYLTARGIDEDSSRDRQISREPAECGLCDERVLPVVEDGTECCPICGFAVSESSSALDPSDRIGRY